MKQELAAPRDHSKYLTKVSDEVVAKRLESFKLDRVHKLEPLPLICKLGEVVIDPLIPKWKPFFEVLRPKTLDDLKEWVGIPDRVARNRREQVHARPTDLWKLPAKGGYTFESLEHDQRLVARQLANSLLYGPVEAEDLKRGPVAAVVDLMLEKANGMHFLLAEDLIVCPGDSVHINGASVLYFNNVLVYGDGAIYMPNNSKLHAHTIRRVTAWT